MRRCVKLFQVEKLIQDICESSPGYTCMGMVDIMQRFAIT